MIYRNTVIISVILSFCFYLCSTTTVKVWGFSSQSTTKLEHQAHDLYNDGKYLQSLSLAKEALQLHPNDPWLLTNIGSTLNELSNFTGAISFYKHALSIDPHHIGGLVGIGSVFEKLGNHSAAMIYYKEALKQPTADNIELLEKAHAFAHLGNYSQAIDIVNQILKQNATNIDALEIKGVSLL